MRCAYCGRDYYYPFKCAYCGNYFCPEHRVPESHLCPLDRQAMNVPSKVSVRGSKAWTTGRLARNRSPGLQISKSGIFLSIWLIGFALGLYFDPGINYLTLAEVSLFNTIIISIFVFGIAGITHRGIGHKLFAVLLIIILAGYFYQNPTILSNINRNSIAELYSDGAAYISSIPASFLSNGASGGNNQLITTSTTAQMGPAIDTKWVQQFMEGVNNARQAKGLQAMTESSSLDQLAQQRLQLETEGNHWQITHYGYQDLPPGVGEVVFFPDGYTPSSFIAYLQTAAPLHWNLLMDSSFSSFGYAIGFGTTLAAYQPCPVTELPGPGINTTQYFQQYGCRTTEVTTTWLVIDMS